MMSDLNNKQNKEQDNDNIKETPILLSFKQIVFLVISCIVVLVLLIIITTRLSLEGSVDIKEKEEAISQEEEAAKYYDITISKKYYTNGFIVLDKEIYYRVPNVFLKKKDKMGDYIQDIEASLKLKENVYTYNVIDGTKYMNATGGQIYKYTDSDEIIILSYEDSENDFDYSNHYIYATEDVIEKYLINYIIDLKNNNIKIKEMEFVPTTSFSVGTTIDSEKANNFLNSMTKYEGINFYEDGALDSKIKYSIFDVNITAENGFYFMFQCGYKNETKELFTVDYLTEENVAEGYMMVVDFIPPLEIKK